MHGARTHALLLLLAVAHPAQRLLERPLDLLGTVREREPVALLPAVGVERRRHALEEVARVRALHDVARRLSLRPAEPAPAHLDSRQARGIAREDAHDVRLVEALRQHRHVRDHLHRAVRERRHLHVLVALPGHHLAADAALRETRLERHAFCNGGEVHQALSPALHVREIEVRHLVHRVVRHEIRAERTEVPFPDQAGDGARAHSLLERELHPVSPERRRGEPQRPLRPQLLVEDHAALGRLVVRLVQHHHVDLRRHPLEEGYRPYVVLVQVAVRLHRLLQEQTAWRHPTDLDAVAERLLEAMDDLKRHVRLPGADWRLQQHGLALAGRKCLEARSYGLYLVVAPLVRHPTRPPARSPRRAGRSRSCGARSDRGPQGRTPWTAPCPRRCGEWTPA